MAEVTSKPRAVKAFQWTGFAWPDPNDPESKPSAEFDEMMDVLAGHQVERRAHNTLAINAPPLGTIFAWPTRDVPEHEYAGSIIPAQTIQGHWITVDEAGHVHLWEDDAYHAAFDHSAP